MHPISGDRMIGVGYDADEQEDFSWFQGIQISMFDVSDPANPRESAKYQLDESWSDVSNTHHAFLADAKHGIFFLPGKLGAISNSHTKADIKKMIS